MSCSRWKALAFTPVLILHAAAAPAVLAQVRATPARRASGILAQAPATPAMSVCQARRTIVAELQRVYVGGCLKSLPSGVVFSAGELEFQAEPNCSKKLFPRGTYRIDLKSLGEVTGEVREGTRRGALRIDGRDPTRKNNLSSASILGALRNDGRDPTRKNNLSSASILGLLDWYSNNGDDAYNAKAVARAMNSLRLFARSYDSSRGLPPVCFADEETQTLFWGEFQKRAAAWRALPTKPPISDEIRQHRLLAEDAYQQKQFENAAAEYEAGLEIGPLWPQGHFNAAVIYGELKDYEDAVWHMRCYLELLPNAPDAQDARDQMLLWQGKLKQQAAAPSAQ
jgi:tetratricopeptide (TPR) repeat protein